MKLRGSLTLAVVGVTLIVADVVQRTVVVGLVHLLPGRRHRILARWQQSLTRITLGQLRRLGGADIGPIPAIPSRAGVLILMNHQSLLDIPVAISAVRPGYPRIVARERYASGKPLISHMIRLDQYPTVNPRATLRNDLRNLGNAARTSPVPLVIYPEGTRTRDGSLGTFRRAGLRSILGSRPWEVWMIVVDGYWNCGRLRDFPGQVGRLRGRARVAGPFPGPDPEAAPEAVDGFIAEMHRRMSQELEHLRIEAAA